MLSSPFILFYIFGTLFDSSLNYNIKALIIGLSFVGVNIGSRLCLVSADPSITESLPVSIYLATKVWFLSAINFDLFAMMLTDFSDFLLAVLDSCHVVFMVGFQCRSHLKSCLFGLSYRLMLFIWQNVDKRSRYHYFNTGREISGTTPYI